MQKIDHAIGSFENQIAVAVCRAEQMARGDVVVKECDVITVVDVKVCDYQRINRAGIDIEGEPISAGAAGHRNVGQIGGSCLRNQHVVTCLAVKIDFAADSVD